MSLQKGDYVLATKYHDGESWDHWAVGFYDRQEGDRHFVVDGEGRQFRGNGFARVGKISPKRGEWLLRHRTDIEFSGKSMWYFIRAPWDAKRKTKPTSPDASANLPQ